jgi:DTW domain-containing protein YfiP
MHTALCLCADIPRVEVSTRVVVLMHWREVYRRSNTARLACLALSNSALHLRGLAAAPLDTARLVADCQHPALLYPTADAVTLTPELASTSSRPQTLFVPDGNWRQASKVATREAALAHVPRFKLPPGPASAYRLRHSPHAEHLCTFEAIARALGILEGDAVREVLEALLAKMVERVLWTRGMWVPENLTRPFQNL